MEKMRFFLQNIKEKKRKEKKEHMMIVDREAFPREQ